MCSPITYELGPYAMLATFSSTGIWMTALLMNIIIINLHLPQVDIVGKTYTKKML